MYIRKKMTFYSKNKNIKKIRRKRTKEFEELYTILKEDFT